MAGGYKDKNGKFHPITPYKSVRKSRDQSAKTQGVRLKRTIQTRAQIKKSIEDVVPLHNLEDEVSRIEGEQNVEQRIPERLRKSIDLTDAVEIERSSKSLIKKVTEEKIDGMTVYNFELENGDEIFIFKSLGDEHRFVEDNIKDRFSKGEYDNKEFLVEHDGFGTSPPEVDEYDLIDFTKMGSKKDITSFIHDHSYVKDKLDDEISMFEKSPLEWLEKMKVKTNVAIKKGALVRDVDKFIAFKYKEGLGELTDFDHPDYQLLTTLPSYKHEFKEK